MRVIITLVKPPSLAGTTGRQSRAELAALIRRDGRRAINATVPRLLTIPGLRILRVLSELSVQFLADIDPDTLSAVCSVYGVADVTPVDAGMAQLDQMRTTAKLTADHVLAAIGRDESERMWAELLVQVSPGDDVTARTIHHIAACEGRIETTALRLARGDWTPPAADGFSDEWLVDVYAACVGPKDVDSSPEK